MMMKIEQQAIEIAKREVLKKLAIEEPWLFAENGLYHQIKQSVGKQKKTFTIHMHNGKVKQLVEHTSLITNYK